MSTVFFYLFFSSSLWAGASAHRPMHLLGPGVIIDLPYRCREVQHAPARRVLSVIFQEQSGGIKVGCPCGSVSGAAAGVMEHRLSGSRLRCCERTERMWSPHGRCGPRVPRGFWDWKLQDRTRCLRWRAGGGLGSRATARQKNSTGGATWHIDCTAVESIVPPAQRTLQTPQDPPTRFMNLPRRIIRPLWLLSLEPVYDMDLETLRRSALFQESPSLPQPARCLLPQAWGE